MLGLKRKLHDYSRPYKAVAELYRSAPKIRDLQEDGFSQGDIQDVLSCFLSNASVLYSSEAQNISASATTVRPIVPR